MADLHRPHDQPDSANHPKVKPYDFRITAQAATEWWREFEAAMDRIEEVAKLLDADAEEMEREAKLLAASTTMTCADALHYIANERLSTALKEGGALHG